MITSLYIYGVHDNFTSSLELDDLNYPIQHFSWEYVTSGMTARKSQGSGRWKTYQDVEYMPINMKGEILADTTSSFWTKRKSLLQKVIPPQGNTEFDHVKFVLTVDGDATQYYAFCILEQNLGALTASGSPTVQEFDLTFECREAYWRKVSDNSYVVI
jgi:hypothetical protein